MPEQIKQRLAYLKKQIEQENISYGEIAELQSLAQYIDPSDTLLLEWAGVPEFEPESNELDKLYEELKKTATISQMALVSQIVELEIEQELESNQ